MKSYKNLINGILVMLLFFSCRESDVLVPDAMTGKILYGYDGSLRIYNPTDSSVFHLTDNGPIGVRTVFDKMLWTPGGWSPDRSKVAFSRWYYGQSSAGLCVINSDGTGLQCFDGNAAYPEWSPDGTRLTFFDIRYEETEDGTVQISDIYSINSDGTNLSRLTDSTEPEDLPIWSPDGSQIAYRKLVEESDKKYQLWVMNHDGADKRLVFDSESVGRFSWSPDGSSIVFGSGSGIMRVDVSTGKPQTLRSGQAGLESNSEDGRLMAIIEHEGDDQLIVIDSEGNEVVRVSDYLDGSNYFPDFSPDGEWLIVVHTNPEKELTYSEIIAFHLKSRTSFLLTNSPKSEQNPSWSPF